jgi:hypothetical protein
LIALTPLETREQQRQVGWKRRRKPHGFPTAGMRETESGRVKGRALQIRVSMPGSSINGVADDRQPNRSQMNPDLMGPSGFGENVERRSLTLWKTPRNTPDRLGLTGSRPSHRHAFAILRMTPDRAIDAPLVSTGCAANHREICAIDRMLVELLREVTMSFVTLGGDQYTRGSPIQAVDDSRPLDSANPGQVAAMVK